MVGQSTSTLMSYFERSGSPLPPKQPITNRRGQTMYVRVDEAQDSQGLVFVQHGFSGGMDQTHLKAVAEGFRRAGYTVAAIDCTHSFNESDGDIAGHSVQTHRHDLDDAVAWARTQGWFKEPYALAGHSLGSFTCLLHAADNPGSVELIVPTATALSGDLLDEAFRNGSPEKYNSFKTRGFHTVYDDWTGKNQRARRTWDWLQDMRRYDIMPKLDRLTMPLCLIVGSNDMPTPPSQQAMLLNAWKGKPKSLQVVDGAEHTFETPAELAALAGHIEGWLKSLRGQAPAPKDIPKP